MRFFLISNREEPIKLKSSADVFTAVTLKAPGQQSGQSFRIDPVVHKPDLTMTL